jgi:hypothetical protein
VTRELNALTYARGAGVGRMGFEEIVAIAQGRRLFAWVLSDDTDSRDGGYWRVFRLSPDGREADKGHGAVVVETAAHPGLRPVFNLYRHDDEAWSDGLAELRAHHPTAR